MSANLSRRSPDASGGTTLNLDDAIRERHSTRNFLPKPVPLELLNEARFGSARTLELQHPAMARIF